jgi:hypothetical protein
VAEVMRHLIFTGGMYHPFDDSAQALREGPVAAGIESTVTDDMDRAPLSHPVHQTILPRSALWVGGRGVALQASRNQESACMPA